MSITKAKKNFLSLYLMAIFFSLLFLNPSFAYADDSTPTWKVPKLQISIPTVNLATKIDCSGTDTGGNKICKVPWIGQYLAGVYKYGIGVVGMVAAIMLMAGGIVWLTAGGNATQVSKAQDYIKGSLFGLVLALMSYTILYTVNPNLVSFKPLYVKVVKTSGYSTSGSCGWAGTCDENYGYSLGTEGTDCATKKTDASSYYSSGDTICCCTTSASTGCDWSSSETCNDNTQEKMSDSNRTKCGTNTSKGKACCCNWSSTPSTYKSGAKFSDSYAREYLAGKGITVPDSVSLENVNQKVLDDLVELYKDCAKENSSCTVKVMSVTGGTHALCSNQNSYTCHSGGDKADLYFNDKLDKKIESYGQCSNNRSDGAEMYQATNGACYAKESGHWDMTWKGCSVWGGKGC